MAKNKALQDALLSAFGAIGEATEAFDEITLEVPAKDLHSTCQSLKTQPEFLFEQLIDLCGVDYLEYGIDQWETAETTHSGFSRGVARHQRVDIKPWNKPRFAVVYHLLSIKNNQRLRVKTFVEEASPQVDSVCDIWASANWYEREAFDLYGLLFAGHPDLRRILSDYGFMGHPFRKDYPLIGEVEMRYDAAAGRVIYEPVSIEPRTLVPKTIRHDARYLNDEAQEVKDAGN